MIVYGASLSPFVRKVMVYGEERGLNLELKMIGLGAPDPDFLAASPFRKMPGFRDGDFTISDSTAIIAYLEAKYPEGRLYPSEPRAAARTVWLEEFADTIAMPRMGKVFRNRVVAPLMGQEGDLAAADAAMVEELPEVYAYLETQVDGEFLVGDSLTVADITVGSLLANMTLCDGSPETAKYPKLCAWAANIHARPSFTKWRGVDHKILKRAA
jgi:glutathione S-transferase